ncbi:uncharacterized protein C01G6.5-like isoform X1 [Saccostrea echinata]|uniref:uncharacterized protein C01G6.5-like isoform X1 n=1 Tax=Saccostrea echinata TaxID=191078 RepID=UPI002A82BF52|nr:uncharacterized protein C01G6.5-like isoform X1 [Saccostrea echinata]
MGTGETTSYHLRRIGPSATCMSIGNNMKLKYGVTKFGRATSNDYYLDSTKLKNFISRIHAEIHAIPNENGDMQFRIIDKGLNGTFINDTKMSGPYILKEGDKVTFGHTNGYKLKAGDYAKQPNSEFQFIFEKLVQKEEERGFRTGDEAAINGNSPMNASSSANTITSIKKSPSKTDQKYNLSKDSTVGYMGSPNVNRISGFDLKSSPSNSDESDDDEDDYNYKPNVNTVSKKSRSVLSRMDYSDESMDSSPSPKPVRKNTGYQDKKQSPSKVRKSADRLSGENGLIPFSDLARMDKSKTKTSRVNVNININVESTVKNNGRRNSNSMRERDTPPSRTQVEIPSKHSRKLIHDKQRARSSSSSSDSNDLPSPDEDSSQDKFNIFSSEENTDIKTLSKKKTPIEKKAAKPAKVQRSNSRGSVKETAKKRKQAPTKTGKPGRRGRPPKKKKKDSDDEDDDFDDEFEIEESLEEGVEWFEEDKCASADCKRPKGKRVGWVCCDDCDEWYHTDCVGCRYDHVKDTNINFSCGCR